MCSYVICIGVLFDMYSRAGGIEESLLRSNRAFPIISFVVDEAPEKFWPYARDRRVHIAHRAFCFTVS